MNKTFWDFGENLSESFLDECDYHDYKAKPMTSKSRNLLAQGIKKVLMGTFITGAIFICSPNFTNSNSPYVEIPKPPELEDALWTQVVKTPQYVGHKLRKSREFLKFTQEQLSIYLKISKETIAKYETGMVRTPTLSTYSKYEDFISWVGILKENFKYPGDANKFIEKPLSILANQSIKETVIDYKEYFLGDILAITRRIFGEKEDNCFG